MSRTASLLGHEKDVDTRRMMLFPLRYTLLSSAMFAVLNCTQRLRHFLRASHSRLAGDTQKTKGACGARAPFVLFVTQTTMGGPCRSFFLQQRLTVHFPRLFAHLTVGKCRKCVAVIRVPAIGKKSRTRNEKRDRMSSFSVFRCNYLYLLASIYC